MDTAAGAILGLGQSPSSFGQTLALVLVFILLVGGIVNFLVGYIVALVLRERSENIERRRAYDELHRPS